MRAAHPRSLRVSRRPLRALLAAGALTATVAAGVGTGSAQASAPAPRAATYSHVIVVVMENLAYSEAITVSGYQTLAHRYASASDAYASTHPSLPNYLDLTSGSTFGISSDCTSCYVSSDNLGAQLSAAHVSWDDFSQGVPHRCFLGAEYGLYAGKHNPFRYYDDIRASYAMCDHLLTYGSFLRDLHPASRMPKFSFVTPNLCNDGHNCSPSVAFTWLSGFVRSVTSSAAWSKHGLLIVTWDEGADSDTSQVLPDGKVLSGGGGGHMPTLFIAPDVPRGTVVSQPVTHEMLLATIEANFGLPALNGAASWTSDTLSLP
jgi:phosphatidylinositol-3-phosphatase